MNKQSYRAVRAHGFATASLLFAVLAPTEQAITADVATVTTPVFTPVAGSYITAPSVSISDSTSGATIYYTLNGTTPTASSTKYTAPIKVASTETIKAIAVMSGHANSDVASAAYTVRTFTIGGKVIGLRSGGTVKVLNGTNAESVSANGTFAFTTELHSGTSYKVSVETQPTGQICALQNESGTVGSVDVTNIVVYCTYHVTAATLAGSHYAFVSYNISKNSNGLYDVSFNGDDAFDGTYTLDSNGTITTGSAGSAPYTVAPNADLIPVLTTGGNNIGGILGADGDAFVWLANCSTGKQPALAMGVNALQGGTNASALKQWDFQWLKEKERGRDDQCRYDVWTL
jgi:LysM repeat protein